MSKASVAASSKSESGQRASSQVTEQDVLQKDVVGPEDVLQLTKPTEGKR